MIGMSEIFVIILAIIIFLRPDDWPKLVYHVGKWYREWQNTYARVMNEIQDIKDLADKKYTMIEHPPFREPFTTLLSTDRIKDESPKEKGDIPT